MRAGLGPAALFLAGGLAVGLGNFVFPYLSARDRLLAWTLCASLPLSAGMLRFAVRERRLALRAAWLVPACLACTLAVEAAAETWWPNSADEYGYVFLARTFLHGRLWNPAPPAPEIFEIAWTYVRDGKWFSQYPPAWSALLAPFLVAHAAWLVNPLLTAGLCALVQDALRRLAVDSITAAAVVVLLMFSPFLLFNGASLFAHTLTAVLVAGIVCLQLREEAAASWPNRAGTGALFGVLLLTRYDVFVLASVPFALDRLWFRRLAVARDAMATALGGLPFALGFLAYNHALTGRVLKTPYAWVSQGAHIGLWGKHVVLTDALGLALLRTAHWAGELAAYTSPALIFLVTVAGLARLRAGALRWHDTLLPVTVGFFFLYPATGGHEFGPRYWFFAWPPAMLTLATGLRGAAPGWLRVGRRGLHAPALAAAHLPAFLGMSLGTSLFTQLYVDQRRQVEDAKPPVPRAVVLIPTRSLMISRWQAAPITAHSADFCRNGTNLSAGILYARADDNFRDGPAFTRAACAFTGRPVFLWQAPGVLAPVDCASGAAGAQPVQKHAG